MDVFLSEVDLNGHEDWETVDAGDVSYVPTNSESDADILAVQMDISSPLSTLKSILGNRLGADLSHCELWLQDLMQVVRIQKQIKPWIKLITVVLQLSDETTLSEQCIQGEGIVQVNLELKSIQNIDRINIVDVLKPQLDDEVTLDEVVTENNEEPMEENKVPAADQVLEEVCSASTVLETECHVSNSVPNNGIPVIPAPMAASLGTQIHMKTLNASRVSCKLPTSQNENITRWVMDGNFRKEQERLKIPLGNH